MTEKIEGTLVLDGLVEGRVKDEAFPEDKLRAWVDFTRSLGLRFSLDISGSSFSLLPDNRPASTQRLGDTPETVLVQALEQLLEAIPEADRSGVFSTLRSAEYRRGEEVQAVYLVSPDGAVKAETRVVDAETVAPPEPIPLSTIVRMAALGLVLAAVLIGITAIFVDVPGLVRRLAGTMRPVAAEDLEVDAEVFEPYFTVADKELERGRLYLTLRRKKGYPTGPKSLQKAWESAGDDLAKRLAVEALARGYVRCEVFDTEGGFQFGGTHRIRRLSKDRALVLAIPLPERPKHRAKSVRLTY